jgi:hypothetical protein
MTGYKSFPPGKSISNRAKIGAPDIISVFVSKLSNRLRTYPKIKLSRRSAQASFKNAIRLAPQFGGDNGMANGSSFLGMIEERHRERGER